MCLYPRIIANPKYQPNTKNGGTPPKPNDIRTMGIPAGCGVCEQCRKKKSREWQSRLHEEIQQQKSTFITLTFSDESIKHLENEFTRITGQTATENDICKLSIKRFRERWRKTTKKSIKHWLITEKGTDYNRIHLHGLIFTNRNKKFIDKIWKYGITWNGEYVNARTINYIIKYITKTDEKHPTFKPIILTSPGIGKKYLDKWDKIQNRYKQTETNETYRLPSGNKIYLPDYWRRKIYTEEEREKLWIEKLNKNERYLGKRKYKFKTRKDVNIYLTDLKYSQLENIQKGYGSYKTKKNKSWDEHKYINQIENIKTFENEKPNQQTTAV